MKRLKLSSLLITLGLGFATHAFAADETASGAPAWVEHVCSQHIDSAQVAEREQHRVDRITERLNLTDKQKALFKDLVNTRAKLRADHQASLCANKPDLSSLAKRLAFMQSWFENHVSDMKVTTPKILAFYNSLDEKQKAEFDGAQQARHQHGPWSHRRWRDSGDRGWHRHHDEYRWHHHHHHHHHHSED